MKRFAPWCSMSIVVLLLLTVGVVRPAVALGRSNAVNFLSVDNAIKTFDFTGTIITVSGTPFGLSPSLGQQVQGTFTYDTSRDPWYHTDSEAVYKQQFPPSGISLVISNITFHSRNDTTFRVVNNANGFDNLSGYSTSILVDGAPLPGSITFNLVDFSQTAFTGTALPPTLDVYKFTYRIGSLFEDPTNSTGPFVFFRIDTLTLENPPPIPVTIDVKPGSFPNSINLKSAGVIPVAVLTTNTFDATTVDAATVLFGATGMEAAPVRSSLEDVDGDRDIDMILHFNTQGTGFQCGDTSASLSGKTVNGKAIEGSDTIRIVKCNTNPT